MSVDQRLINVPYPNTPATVTGVNQEAVRDLLRQRLDLHHLQVTKGQSCVTTVTCVYDDLDHTVSLRVLTLQHDHHDLVVSSMRN